MLYYPRMYPLLYFQPSTKTSAPEKLAGVRDIMVRRGHAVQVIEERPTARLVRELWEFWHPLGAIVDCGGEYNDIDAQLFAGRSVVFLGHNPDTLPPTCLLVSNDQAKTARRLRLKAGLIVLRARTRTWKYRSPAGRRS